MTFHIKSTLQKIWSRIGISLIERRAHHGFVDETIQFIASARLQRIDAPAHDSWLPGRETGSSRSRTTYSILRYLEAREEQINRTAALLADEMSRDTLKRLLAFRAVGPHHVNPPIEVNRTVAYYKRAKELMIAPSSNDLPPFEVEIFRVPFGSTTVDVECWLGSLVATFFERQYYLEHDGVSISPRQGDIVIDAGACFGDTALAFATNIGSEGMVHSFEPMASQRAFYVRNRERNPGLADVLRIYDYALDKVSDDVVHFSNGGAGARPVRDGGGIEIKTITIDDFVQRFSLARVDFLKMDIEGADRYNSPLPASLGHFGIITASTIWSNWRVRFRKLIDRIDCILCTTRCIVRKRYYTDTQNNSVIVARCSMPKWLLKQIALCGDGS